jgi:hypothetical protein
MTMIQYNWIELAIVGVVYMSGFVTVAALVTALLFHYLDKKSKTDDDNDE